MKKLIFCLMFTIPFIMEGQEVSLQLVGSSGAEMANNNAILQSAMGEPSIAHFPGLTEGLLQGVQKTSSRKNTTAPLLSLEMYPNPVADQAFLRKDFQEPVRLHFYDEAGRLISSLKMANNQLSVNCHDWPSGMYFIRIEHEDVQFKSIQFTKF